MERWKSRHRDPWGEGCVWGVVRILGLRTFSWSLGSALRGTRGSTLTRGALEDSG